MQNWIRNRIEKGMVSGRPARSRKSDPGAKGSISGRLARSRKSGPGGPEVVNDKCDKEFIKEMNGFRWASQI